MQENYLKKLIISLFFFIGITTMIFAQISEGGTPKSFGLANNKSNIDKIVLNTPNVEQLKYEDEFYNKNAEAMRIGVPISVNVNPKTAGTWIKLPNGDRIWRLIIEAKSAKFISVHYSSFSIPSNGKLFLYSANKTKLIGAFTSKNNPKNAEFANEMIPSDKIIIEYNESAVAKNTKNNKQTELNLNISHIIYYYKGFSAEEKAADACEININCSPVGDNWQDEKRGVAKIDMNGYLCTGTLINNTSQDCTPYFLTAYHCSGNQSAPEHNQWIFYFNYEASTCSGTTGTVNTTTGCTIISTSDANGGSDLQLVKLNSQPLESWNLYFNGWDRSTEGCTGGAGIHHPQGDIKKISTFTETVSTTTVANSQPNAHWLVHWAENDNGWGVTEAGSSGSPLFNNNGLIVGTLTGGTSFCTSPTSPDSYGKMDKHWVNGNLSQYLDPLETGATTLEGTNTPCVADADFIANPTTVVLGSTVIFNDYSTGVITNRTWSFPGGTPDVSNDASPVITYNNVGTYDVTLTVNDGEDTETKTDFINVINVDSATLFTLDFEASNDFDLTFDPWTVKDVDGTVTHGINNGAVDFPHSGEAMAFIAFNPTTCTPSQTLPAPHGGDRFGACFASIPTQGSTNNDWLISPKVQLGTNSVFKLWVKTHNDQWGKEKYKIGVSTTTNDPSAFTIISDGAYEEAPTAWTEKTYSLVNYDNQEVYVAINCISEDVSIFMVDDIEIITNPISVANINKNSIKIYPNPTTGLVNIEGIDNYNELQIIDIQGKTVIAINTFTNVLDVSDLPKGNYIIRIISDKSVITKKLTLIK